MSADRHRNDDDAIACASVDATGACARQHGSALRASVPPCSILLVLLTLMACKKDETAAPLPGVGQPAVSVASAAPPAFAIKTPSWFPGQRIPKEFTCDGEDKSPEVTWENPPKGTLSYALVVDDPDAPGGKFTHWMMFDVAHPSTHLADGAGDMSVGTTCKNDFGKPKWGGPCPPQGKGEHRYFFHLYALDVKELGPKDGCSRAELEKAMDGHVLAKVETMGTYARP